MQNKPKEGGGVCNICIRPMSKVSSFCILVGAGAQSDLFGLDGRGEGVRPERGFMPSLWSGAESISLVWPDCWGGGAFSVLR